MRRAYPEATRQVSIYCYSGAESVRPGLPIWPGRRAAPTRRAVDAGPHACAHCGQVQVLARGTTAVCPACEHAKWLPAYDAERVG